MKILPNIPGFIKLLSGLRTVNKFKTEIDKAVAAGNIEAEKNAIHKSTVAWSNEMMQKFNCKLEIEGEENIPNEGPVVVMSNHQGNADILAILYAFQKIQLGFIAKEELSRIPLYGDWIKHIRSVFIKRHDPKSSLEAIMKGVEYIKDGFSLVIFPEGTRAQCSTPNPFMKGPVKLATKPGVPIIPVSIDGTYKMFEETGVIRPTTFKMIVHEPIETAGMTRKEEKELTEKVEKIIVDGVKKLSGAE